MQWYRTGLGCPARSSRFADVRRWMLGARNLPPSPSAHAAGPVRATTRQQCFRYASDDLRDGADSLNSQLGSIAAESAARVGGETARVAVSPAYRVPDR